MTTPTPTSEAPGAGGQALPGLPDLALLSRLANEFFSAAPGTAPTLPSTGAAGLPSRPPASLQGSTAPALGGVPLPVNPQPGGVALPPVANGPALPGHVPVLGVLPGANLVPTSPQTALNLGANAPALVPHAAAPNGLPDAVTTSAPALDSRSGGQALGVPAVGRAGGGSAPAGEPSLAALPASPAHVSTPSQFYFLGGPTLPVQAAPPAELQRFGVHSLFDEPLSHQPPGLSSPTADARAQTSTSTPTTQPFYFVDPQRHAGPHGHHAGAVPNAAASAHPPFDVHAIRRDFPILAERVNGRQLVWFDNAATTHKPQAVIDRLAHFYAHENSNIHRAAHALAARATDAYESARHKVARFVNAASSDEIVFVRGCTEAINLIAKTWGVKNVGQGDEIIVSHLEHHANIVPWQQLCQQVGAVLRVIPVDDSGQVILSEFQRLLNPRTKLVSVTQVSNALGTVVPVQEIVAIAHRHGVCALVDGAQSVSHMAVDVQALDADFFVFSGHKVFGPTGIGVVYGKQRVLEDMPPWQGGGNMIADVTFERTVYQGVPARFEAGTGNIADAVGLGAALDYVQRIGLPNIARYEHDLLAYATDAIRPIPGLRLIGTARDKASVLSFVLAGHSTEDVGKALNEEGIAVRSGHHCAQPILRRFGVETTVRPSLAFYNTCDEVDRMVAVVRRLAGR